MSPWIGSVARQPIDRQLDVSRWHRGLLGESVREDYGLALMEEIQDAVVDGSVAKAQLVHPASEVVGLGSPKLVAELREALHPNAALRADPVGDLVEPGEQWDGSVVLLEQDDSSAGHDSSSAPSRDVRKYANVRQAWQREAARDDYSGRGVNALGDR
jgi:hypothetical protein